MRGAAAAGSRAPAAAAGRGRGRAPQRGSPVAAAWQHRQASHLREVVL